MSGRGAQSARRWATRAVLAAMTGLLAGVAGAQPSPPVPVGLWRNVDDGMVIRIEACGDALCGHAAGAPAEKATDARSPRCNDRILRDLRWNTRTQRYDGTLTPPGGDRTLRSTVETDGRSRLVLRARMMLMSRTLTFAPFTGTIGAGCRIEPTSR